MTRAEKAQRLVDEGRVDILHTSESIARAEVRGEHDVYLIIFNSNGDYFCSCDWYCFHTGTTDLCAHALAVKLAMAKEKEP